MSNMFDGATSLTALNTTDWDTNPLPDSTNWISGMSGTIYCNDPDGGGTGPTGTGTINTTTNCASIYTDTDGDGIADIMESLLGFDPAVAELDTDGDGVPDTYDSNNSSNVDSDGDGISDELETIVAVKAPNRVGDFDGDGIADGTDRSPLNRTPMITKWLTPQNKNIVLPLVATGTYNLTVDWGDGTQEIITCLLYTSPSPRDGATSRMPSSA